MQYFYPSLYINDTDPTAITARSPSTWFVSETQENVPEESLGWMEAQGWISTPAGDPVSGKQLYNMKRRRIDPEKVLGDLVSDYTAAYNQGRTLNDQRYDDIVAIYCALEGAMQNDSATQEADDDTYDALIETILTSVSSDFAAHSAAVTDYLDDYGTSIVAQINARFDAKSTAAQQDLTDRGMNNTTIWASVSAGVERERSLALSDVADKIMQQELVNKHKVYEQQANVHGRVLAARDRLWASVSSASDRRLASRNAIVSALMNFMERRTDSYPDLAQVGNLAANLGAGNPTGIRS